MKKILSLVGRILASLACLISNTATIGWEGEVEPPKSLLK